MNRKIVSLVVKKNYFLEELHKTHSKNIEELHKLN